MLWRHFLSTVIALPLTFAFTDVATQLDSPNPANNARMWQAKGGPGWALNSWVRIMHADHIASQAHWQGHDHLETFFSDRIRHLSQ